HCICLPALAWTDCGAATYIPAPEPGIKKAPFGSLEKTMAQRRFEELVLPHLDAAFNYARWLTKNDADAQDVVQDASVRALRFLSSLRGSDARAWLLTIVRNTWYGRFSGRDDPARTTVFNDMSHDRTDSALDPEARLMQQQTIDRVRGAIEQLPAEFREAIVL